MAFLSKIELIYLYTIYIVCIYEKCSVQHLLQDILEFRSACCCCWKIPISEHAWLTSKKSKLLEVIVRVWLFYREKNNSGIIYHFTSRRYPASQFAQEMNVSERPVFFLLLNLLLTHEQRQNKTLFLVRLSL